MPFSLAMARHRLAVARTVSALRASDGGTADADPSLARSMPERPEGPLIWFHGCEPRFARAIDLLAGPLAARARPLTILLTGLNGDRPAIDAIVQPPPVDALSVVRRFLDHWHPQALVWIGTAPAPILWAEALRRRIPCIALDADPARHALSLVQPLARFDLVLAARPDPRLGSSRVDVASPLSDVPRPPPVYEPDREALATLLATRPVWLASAVPEAEIAAILAAHEEAAKLSHRLLLILEPDDPADGPDLHARLEGLGWRCALRSLDEEPILGTQVYIADQDAETGLWMRLAPITFLGGTLDGIGATASAAYGAAALGSVVLHGGTLGTAAEALGRLHAGGAAWRVGDAAELGRAVERFLAPDRAADMAAAGWAVVTAGAESTDRAIQALAEILDRAAQ
ncbi:3-deoxy-D-manno-octulosonic-acid [Oceaniovalibus guishaninsula JLT2003]|uniref:3-deoxy-D-manno-octulosonic acid transferase n=1 Tax=Oceaniovalibus guishaninsula JLT2003 TaxID=1231392 RepID=K2HBP1_9RHOB|nr:glycosyltransferase N-terminal domain-containing protein [Oceaniovalibus guishaninsula]EKE44913.1 3-deoxy-D-manno-octulosonic-acid [Oceaniovalibus guishaninsula JLT2003]